MKLFKSLKALALVNIIAATSCTDTDKLMKTRALADRLVADEIRASGGTFPIMLGPVMINSMKVQIVDSKVVVDVDATATVDLVYNTNPEERRALFTNGAAPRLCNTPEYTVFLGHGGEVSYKLFDKFGKLFTSTTFTQKVCDDFLTQDMLEN